VTGRAPEYLEQYASRRQRVR